MNSIIITKNYKEPPFCEKEILRYAGCKSSDDELLQLLRACIEEVRGKLAYKICYCELPVIIREENCDFDCMTIRSRNLAKNLQGCKKVIVFAATLGVEIDRLIAKYGRISPTKALMFQAIGAERIEALCDAFCEEIQIELCDNEESGKKVNLRPRFSPGYGDLSLEVQKEIFQILDCSKRIGLSLNDSLLMSPSKSVTAFVGVVKSEEMTEQAETTKISNEGLKRNKCTACNKADCEYRGV
ncbi:MAG: Vitamin B12 dependent methionine synthase activation subunit [Agathobacter sp.]|nr:Vitamin B12 dependent methionine synthase activation subunit [Agathobacter sp.]